MLFAGLRTLVSFGKRFGITQQRWIKLYVFMCPGRSEIRVGLSAYLCLSAALSIAPWTFPHAAAQEPASKNSLIPVDPATQRPDSNTPQVLPPINFEQTYDTGKISLRPEYGSDSGFVLGATLAKKFSDNSAGGLLLSAGSKKQEIISNLGLGIGDNHRMLVTFGLLRQKLDFSFASGSVKEFVNQYAGVLGYQYYLSDGFFNALEFNGYATKTPSRELDSKQYNIDTATFYELWNDNRRIAGSRITGYQAQLVMVPNVGGSIKLGAGAEQLRYDLLAGEDKTTRATGNAEWSQSFRGGFGLKLAANTAAAQNRYSVDLSRNLRDDQRLSLGYAYIQDREGSRNDQRINLGYSWTFGPSANAKPITQLNTAEAAPSPATAKPESTNRPQRSAQGWSNSLINLVATRPSVLPSQVIAKLDSTATPTRLVAINKTSLPAGSSINTTTTQITVPLGTKVTGLASITRNRAAFANAGQFNLIGNNLIIDPKSLQQPAVGVTDTYVVTVNTAAGGTILATTQVSHGSVKIDSITLIQLADAVAPVAVADSATTAFNTAKTGIDVLANDTDNSGVAPTLTGILTNPVGGAFTINANKIDFIPTIGFSGMASVTYEIKDEVGNKATGTLSITVGPDTTGPVAVADTSTTDYNTAKTGIDVLANDTDNSGATPTLTGVLTNPVGGTFTVNAGKIDFTPTTGFSGNASVTYEIKDGSGNKATGSLTITVAAADTTPDAFTFVDQSDISLSTLTESAEITVSGINAASAISVTGGEYQINGGAWTSTAGTVTNNQTVKVRHTSSASDSSTTNTVLTIGGVSDTFTTTTATPDTTPDAFSFVDQTNVALQTLTESAAITVAGIDADANISITGGEYQINSGAWTSAAGTVSNGQTVKVRHTSSASNSSTTNTVLTIGGVSDTFTTTTKPLPAGYILQGGLTWMPNTAMGGPASWTTANDYCTKTTINGQTGWRLPEQTELSSLYSSGSLAGQPGWASNAAWSSTPKVASYYYYVHLNNGFVGWAHDTSSLYVTCVR